MAALWWQYNWFSIRSPKQASWILQEVGEGELCLGSDNAVLTKSLLGFHRSLMYLFSVLQHVVTLCLTWKYQNRWFSWGAFSCLRDWQDPFGSLGKGQPRVFVLYQKASFIGVPNLLAFLSHGGRIVLNYTLNRRRPNHGLLAGCETHTCLLWVMSYPACGLQVGHLYFKSSW